MKLLVIGAQGQLARCLFEAGKTTDFDVVGVGRLEIDLLDVESVLRVVRQVAPRLVINAAAYTAVDRAESEPATAFAINAEAPGHIAKACAHNHTPLIHISTDYVFDGTNQQPYCEEDEVAPLGVYGRSKFEGERRVAEAWAQHMIVRTAWIYSPFGNNFAKTMLKLARNRAELSVVDDQVGNPTYGPQLATAILSAGDKLVRSADTSAQWGTYHLAGAGATSWFNFAREIFIQSMRLGGPVVKLHPITTREYSTPAKRPLNSTLDSSKFSRAFGISLPHWRSGVAECVARLLRCETSGGNGSLERT
jgi:dTDP-4-dehydrorhamnose reductase